MFIMSKDGEHIFNLDSVQEIFVSIKGDLLIRLKKHTDNVDTLEILGEYNSSLNASKALERIIEKLNNAESSTTVITI